MLIRLLVAVLTLAGPTPFRVCTCAAAHAALTSESHAALHGFSHGETGHESHSSPDGTAESHSHPDSCGQSHQPTQHEPECPAANPRPLVREAVPPVTPDAPSGSAQVAAAEAPPLTGPHPASSLAHRPDRASNVPLYLTFLTLRN
jgi:hypothetical protein